MRWWIHVIAGITSVGMLILYIVTPQHIEIDRWIISSLFTIFFFSEAWRMYHGVPPK